MKIDLGDGLRGVLQAIQPTLEDLIRRVLREEVPRLVSGDPDQLLDAEQAAALIGMSPSALRRATERGRFPVEPVRIGRRLRWRRGDIVSALRRDANASSRETSNTTARKDD